MIWLKRLFNVAWKIGLSLFNSAKLFFLNYRNSGFQLK